jgi:hypothetical protein
MAGYGEGLGSGRWLELRVFDVIPTSAIFLQELSSEVICDVNNEMRERTALKSHQAVSTEENANDPRKESD